MNANRLLPLALAAITSAQAETFWLVTRMLPQPYNPHPQAEKQLIRSNAHGGIWLVDDTPWNPLPPDWPNRELITLSNLVHAWTNQVPIPEEKPVVIYKTWPQKNYYNTNLMTPGE